MRFFFSGFLAWGCFSAVVALPAMVLAARAVVIDAPQGGHGDAEIFYTLILGIASGVLAAAAIGSGMRSWIAVVLALGSAPLAVPVVIIALAPYTAELLAPWLCPWPSSSGGQCANCARLLHDPVALKACEP